LYPLAPIAPSMLISAPEGAVGLCVDASITIL